MHSEDAALTFLTIQRASSRPRCMISDSRWGSVSAEKLTNADLPKREQMFAPELPVMPFEVCCGAYWLLSRQCAACARGEAEQRA